MKTEFSGRQNMNTRQAVACPAQREEEPYRHEDFFELSSDGYLVTDASGTIHDANHAATVMLNMARGALVGKPVIGFVVEADRNTFFAQLGGLLRMPALQEWEVRMQRRGGTPFPAAITAMPVRNSAGHLVSLRWVLRDITERWLAEEALRESNDLLSKLIQYSHDAIFIVETGQRKILDVNSAACRMLGYSRKQLLSLPAPAIFQDPQSALKEYVEAAGERGDEKTGEIAFATHPGDVLPAKVSVVPVNVAGAGCVIVIASEIRADGTGDRRKR